MLTRGQVGILFECLASPVRDLYVNQACWLVDNDIAPFIVDAVEELGRRHEILSARFTIVDGHWMRGSADDHLTVAQLDAGDTVDSAPDLWRASLQRIREDCSLDQTGQLTRFHLFNVSESQAMLVWTFHHVLLDGWSVELLVRELEAAVAAKRAGDSSVLATPPALGPVLDQLTEHAAHRNDSDSKYWRDRFQDLGPLPIAQGPAETALYHEAFTAFTVDATKRIKSSLRELGITLGTLAVLAVVLGRYMRDWKELQAAPGRSVVIGTVHAGRPDNVDNVQDAIGLFAHVVPCVVPLPDPAETVPVWMHRVQSLLARDHAHTSLSLARIQDVAGSRGKRLFDTGVSVDPFDASQRSGVLKAVPASWRAGGALPPASKADYVYSVSVNDGPELAIETSIAAGAVSGDEADLFSGRLRHAFEYLAAEKGPIIPAAAIPPQEIATLLTRWNDTTTQYSRDITLVGRFTDWAGRTPDRICVESPQGALTFRELDERSNQLGHRLRELDVGPESIVGLRMQRGCASVVAMLGVWKAGGAYLPIEPSWPAERLAFIVSDANLQVVLTDSDADMEVPAPARALPVDLERWMPFADRPTFVPESGALPHNLAQVLYTSGSTGRPKGVLLEHRNISRYVQQIRGIEWSPQLRTLHYSPLSFDAHTYELWAALLNGGTAVIAQPVAAVEAVHDGVMTQRVNAMWMASSFFNHMVDANLINDWPEVTIAVGGEAVSPTHIARAYARAPRLRLVNIYGPTETSVKAVTHSIERDEESRTRAPIGTPLPNVHVYVLDDARHLLPIGAVGELYIGGEGVARGYLRRPELNAERFLDDPFRPGDRLYRTGDLVRWSPAGVLEFVGRDDDQVKVNGHRVELGEVQAVARELPEVSDACVLAEEDGRGGRELALYVVVAADHHTVNLASTVRRGLARTVPEFMVPARIVVVDFIPWTDRGKLDKTALRARGTAAPAQAPGRLPVDGCLSHTEVVVLRMCADLLAHPELVVDDDIYDLGATSVLVLRLIAGMRTRFGLVDIPPGLVRARSVRQFSQYVSGTG